MLLHETQWKNRVVYNASITMAFHDGRVHTFIALLYALLFLTKVVIH